MSLTLVYGIVRLHLGNFYGCCWQIALFKDREEEELVLNLSLTPFCIALFISTFTCNTWKRTSLAAFSSAAMNLFSVCSHEKLAHI